METHASTDKRCKGVLAGEFDAAFVDLPHNLRAVKEGAREITVRPMPMIRGVTLTTTMAYVRSHEEEIRLLIRGTVEAVHFFLTQPEKTKRILTESPFLGLQNDEEVSALYDSWVGIFGTQTLSQSGGHRQRVRPGGAAQTGDSGLQSFGHVEYALLERVGRQRFY